MKKWERFAAWLLLLNGGLGLCVALGISITHGESHAALDALPSWSLFGTLAGLLALRTQAIGLVAGMLYYLPQMFSFYSKDFSFSVRSGISLAWVIPNSAGVLVINLAAMAFAALSATLLARHVSFPKQGLRF
jgi:hypothetical protein